MLINPYISSPRSQPALRLFVLFLTIVGDNG